MAAIGYSSLVAPVSVSAGAGQDASGFVQSTVTIEGTFTATYQVQISCDPAGSASSFVNFGSTVTAAGSVAVTTPCLWVRLNCTAYTSGTPTARLAGVIQH